MNSVHILGVRVDTYDREAALQGIASFFETAGQHKVFTPNPEMLVDAHADPYFKEVLNSGSLNICDGRGVELVSRGRLHRIAGVDFLKDICEMAQKKEKSIYLLGSGSEETLKKAHAALRVLFPRLRMVGCDVGPSVTTEKRDGRKINVVDKQKNDAVIHDIIMKAPDILFVGFGHGKQEKWIDTYLPELPSVRIAMGVGGAFDFLAGNVKRAPQWIQKIGFEWLWRLVLQPWRAKRIFKATVIFMYNIISNTDDRKQE